MRIIKVRAWDEKFKTMRYNAVVGFNPDQKIECGLLGGSSCNGFEVFIGRWEDEKTFTYFPVMEWTGKVDKNGNEIYDGDVNQDGGKVIRVEDSASFCWQYPNGDIHEFNEESEWCEIVSFDLT